MNNLNFKDLLNFDKLIVPKLIIIIYYLGVIVTVLSALGTIIAGLGPFGGGGMVIMGLIMLVVGPLTVRIMCELYIVLFKMYEKLSIIAEKE
ncbi:MAG: DUF4282 domain-containing protein [Clostridiales bacterium]|nr:DUF4282 domain-containing protein [Clostridiales bacterium]